MKIKETKAKIEALLFCNADGLDTKRIAKLCGIGSVGHVKAALREMQQDFEKRGAGLHIINQGGNWKMIVRNEHLPLVREAAEPEMDKAVLQTLAYIAHRGKAAQSTVVKVRSNKAYDHIKLLEKEGLVKGEKKGTTRTLYPTKKFYRYFDLKEGEPLELEDV